MSSFVAVGILAVLVGAGVQEPPKRPDLFEELRASDAVVRLSVTRPDPPAVAGKVLDVFKGQDLRSGDAIAAEIERYEGPRGGQVLPNDLKWLCPVPPKDESGIFVLRRQEKTWAVRVILFGYPRASRGAIDWDRFENDAVRKCLDIAQAAPANRALLQIRQVCASAFDDPVPTEVMMLYQSGLSDATIALPKDHAGLQQLVSTYHPKVVNAARKHSGRHAGTIAWFSRLGSEEQRLKILEALVQRLDEVDAQDQQYLKQAAQRAKEREESGFPGEREQTIDEIFGPPGLRELPFVKNEIGAIVDPGSEKERSPRREKAIRKAREMLKR